MQNNNVATENRTVKNEPWGRRNTHKKQSETIRKYFLIFIKWWCPLPWSNDANYIVHIRWKLLFCRFVLTSSERLLFASFQGSDEIIFKQLHSLLSVEMWLGIKEVRDGYKVSGEYKLKNTLIYTEVWWRFVWVARKL